VEIFGIRGALCERSTLHCTTLRPEVAPSARRSGELTDHVTLEIAGPTANLDYDPRYRTARIERLKHGVLRVGGGAKRLFDARRPETSGLTCRIAARRAPLQKF